MPVLGRARHGRPAPELPRRARRLAGGAARLRAVPLGAAPRHADARRRSSGSRSPSPSTTTPSRAWPLHSRTARARPGSASTRSRSRASGTRATSARPRCCATSRPLVAEPAQPADAPPRGGARGGLGRRADPRGDRVRVARGLHGDGSTSPARCRSDGSVEETQAAARRVSAASRALPLAWPIGRAERRRCCPLYHEAVELVGQALDRRDRRGPAATAARMRFSEIAAAVPELCDRLLSERMKELEARGIVERTSRPGRRCASVRADRDGPRARAGGARAAAWAGAGWTTAEQFRSEPDWRSNATGQRSSGRRLGSRA